MNLKYIILLIYCSSFLSFGQSEFKKEFEIEFNIGGGKHGFHTLYLLREGLLCKTISLNKGKVYTKFFPFSKLNKDIYVKIQSYIYDYKIDKIKKIIPPKHSVQSSNYSVQFKVYDLELGTQTTVYYGYCDERVDGLIKLINSLIPKNNNRKRYKLSCKCGNLGNG